MDIYVDICFGYKGIIWDIIGLQLGYESGYVLWISLRINMDMNG